MTRFGFEGWIWVLIASVPGLYIRFTFIARDTGEYCPSLRMSADTSNIASFDIRTRDNIHRYQYKIPILAILPLVYFKPLTDSGPVSDGDVIVSLN